MLALASCTQDELTDSTNTLPEGMYPLEITSATLSVESSEQPWTRVSENTDRNSSTWDWDGTEQIGVQLGGNTTVYTLNANKTLTSETPLYWENTQTATIDAWYPATDGTLDLSDQNEELAYVLKGLGTGNYQSAVTLNFTHALAKVRIKLTGSDAVKVTDVKLESYTNCSHTKGTVVGSNVGNISMLKVDGATWEANVVPGYEIKTIEVNGAAASLAQTVTPAAGSYHQITLTVTPVPGDAQEITGDINGNGNYVVRGTRNEAITITGGSPTIYLEGATVSVSSGNGINITGGNPTIHVVGESNSVTGSAAGIYVASGSTLTITGDSRNDKLTAQAGGNAAGIGGCGNDQDCGSININNVTVIARGSQDTAISPGIGSTGNNNCGQITIDNATVHAYGEGINDMYECPAIGPGLSSTTEYGNLPVVIIRNDSEVHAHRGGGNADYIGYPYVQTIATGAESTVNPGTGGGVYSSTVYCYTGTSTTTDKVMVYDANGTGTEQSQ